MNSGEGLGLTWKVIVPERRGAIGVSKRLVASEDFFCKVNWHSEKGLVVSISDN